MRRSLALLLILVGALTGAQKRPAPVSAADRWMHGLTLRQRIAQLIVIRSYGDLPPSRTREYKQYVHWVRDLQVGGLIVVNRVRRGAAINAEPYEMVAFVNRMQKLAKLPLLVAGDFERGASMRVSDTVKFPHAMAFAASGDPHNTFELGRITARESRALGVQWVFAPDADVNNNADNPIIGIRSFGQDPVLVGEQVRAFIQGAHSETAQPVLVTAKHFPGHGDTATDSHLGLPLVENDLARLRLIEFPPFASAIAAGVDSVMTAHIAMPKIDEEGVPATISRTVIHGLLQTELKFKGIVTTDAMDMNGLTASIAPGEAAVRALEAGVDVLLMPSRPDIVIDAVAKAVARGRISAKRIDESVRKILAAKAKVGLPRGRFVNADDLADVLGAEDAQKLAVAVAEQSVTLMRGDPIQPLNPNSAVCVLALTERRGSQQGLQLREDLLRRAPHANVTILDPALPQPVFDQALADTFQCESVVVAGYLGFGGRGEMHPAYQALLDGILAGTKPVTLAALGNPYVLRRYPLARTWITTYSNVPVSETAFVRALFGEIPANGKKVVEIPQ